jgi:SAM-dependent methyltransferase
MDETTRKVSEMYERFPYPSPQSGGRKLKELASLLTFFCAETGYRLSGKCVLDAGTGTGHRLIEAAAAFKEAQFTAVDICEAPLEIARRAAAQAGVQNIEFRQADLMEMGNTLGTFDVIVCMGVIHHLSDPAAGLRNLVRNLADDGILFLYVYGKHGSRERLRKKRIVSLLRNGDAQDFEQGISLVKELGFDSFEYGWNLDFDDEESRNALIVDAYLNVNETQFDVDGIFDLMRPSGLHEFAVYGISIGTAGCLFDTRLQAGTEAKLFTDVSAHLPSASSREAYERLSLMDKYRLIDLLFQPNGYTLVGFKSGALRQFPPDCRPRRTALTVATI